MSSCRSFCFFRLENMDFFFDCNPATLKVFGYPTRDEFLGKHPAEVSPPRQADGRAEP